jgi:hypothetical protein
MTSAPPPITHCFEYFPGNYMWSQGMNLAMELAPWGGGAVGEVDQVGQRLRPHLGDNDAWFREWTALAERIERRADVEAAQGHDLTAGGLYQRAATYF